MTTRARGLVAGLIRLDYTIGAGRTDRTAAAIVGIGKLRRSNSSRSSGRWLVRAIGSIVARSGGGAAQMATMEASTPVVTGEQVRAFTRDGFVVVPGLLT